MGKQFTHDRILVVDDFSNMRTALRRMLHELGEDNVDVAVDGEEAIKRMKKQTYDIILCDYNLGAGKDGQQVLEEAQASGILPASSIFVMITAETTRTFVLGALEHAPDDYVTKPFTKELLLFRLKKANDRNLALREIHQCMEKQEWEVARDLCVERLKEKSKYTLDYLRLLSQMYLHTQEYAKAQTSFERVLASCDLPWARAGLAKAWALSGEHERAVRQLRELLAGNAYYLEAYDWLARSLLALGQSQEAQEVLMEAAKYCHKCVDRQRQLGNIALQNDDLEVAEKAFRVAIRNGEGSIQKSASEYTGLVRTLTRQGKTHKALLTLQSGRKAMEGRHEDLLQVLTETADLYLNQNQTADALAVLGEAKSVYRKHAEKISPQTTMQMARSVISSGDKEMGTRILAQVIQNNHDDEQYLDNVRTLLADLGMSETIEEIMNDTVGKMSEINRQGIEFTKNGQLEEAISLFEQAAENSPSNRSFNLNAAQAMILHMQKNGPQPSLIYKVRQFLDRVASSGKADHRHSELSRMYREFTR